MLVKAFFRWSETAKAADRAKAANALGRAYLQSPLSDEDRRSTCVAMTYLLDDPSPKVRLAVAETLGYVVKNNIEDYSAGVPNDLDKIVGAYKRGE